MSNNTTTASPPPHATQSNNTSDSQTNDENEWRNIDTTGSFIKIDENNKMVINLSEKVTHRAFKQVLMYLYTDHTDWDKDTEKDLIKETQEAAKYLQLKRLEAIAETHLDKSKQISIPESTWWKNMKWAYNNLREGKWSLSDLTLVCLEDNSEVHCHAIILTSACKYFHSMLLGDVENEQKETMRIEIKDATKSQMLSVLKYIYTREFDVSASEVISVWLMAHKFLLEDLQIECESLVMKNIDKNNLDQIRAIAEMVQSNRVIDLCDEIKSQ